MKIQGTVSFVSFAGFVLLALLAGCASTPDLSTPSVRAFDQWITGDTVVVSRVVATSSEWIVIRAEAAGAPGPIIGFAEVPAGLSRGVKVKVDAGRLTDVLYAELDSDAGTPGRFDPGRDVPVTQPVKLARLEAGESYGGGGGGGGGGGMY